MHPKVIIADDHPIIVAGIQQIIQNLHTFRIVATAKDGRELLALLDSEACDILIIDYSMPQSGGPDGYPLIEFIKRRYPDIKILLLTMLDNPVMLRNLDALGIQGIVSKRDRFNNIASAIDMVSRGVNYRSTAIQKLLSPDSSTPNTGHTDLTAREFEVLRLFAEGLSVSEIADKLNKSVKTVSTQKISAMKKLRVSNDIDLYNAIKTTGMFTR
ncbi:response regulator transcription factor [Burkholderia cenocepacia]|uniref:response regulator transcription factor n=1 Tax=Burkholderia cenocepacia TaxID=95486 RepID=UPI00285E2279|nr:response regulator transcription factor [Burkholderia cenocepacia]MDR8050302.1 response regulator transcription factor [Burkholderia cenocepacia]